MAPAIPVSVTIDLGGDTMVFDAFTRDETWNGWAVPYFTESEGRRMARWTDDLASRFPGEIETISWNPHQTGFVLSDPACPDEPDFVPAETLDGIEDALYGIGARRWAWDLVNTDGDWPDANDQ